MIKYKKRIISLFPIILTISFLLSTASPVFSKPIIPFGFCPKYNPRIMYQLYQPFINYLNEVTPYQFEIKLSRVYQDIIDRIGKGEISIASCGPVSYIKAREKSRVTQILCFSPAVEGVGKMAKENNQGRANFWMFFESFG